MKVVTVISTLAVGVMLSACSSAKPSVEDQVIEKVHTNAPSWGNKYSDAELKEFFPRVCDGDTLDKEVKAGAITLEDEGYFIGVVTSAICIREGN